MLNGKYRIKTATISFLVVFLTCCTRNHRDQVVIAGVPTENNQLDNVKILLKISPEGYDSISGYVFNLIIRNDRSQSLNDCTIMFDKEYSAKLYDTEVYKGFIKGHVVLQQSNIPGNGVIKIQFNHDNNNFGKFSNVKKSAWLSSNILPRIISLTTSSGYGEWELKKLVKIKNVEKIANNNNTVRRSKCLADGFGKEKKIEGL